MDAHSDLDREEFLAALEGKQPTKPQSPLAQFLDL